MSIIWCIHTLTLVSFDRLDSVGTALRMVGRAAAITGRARCVVPADASFAALRAFALEA